MNPYRSHYAGKLEEEHAGEEIRLAGFVETIREHKHQIFMHLRDETGRLQVVVDGGSHPDLFRLAGTLRAESVVQIKGVLEKRPPGTARTRLDTNTIELSVVELKVVWVAGALPFPLDEGRDQVDPTLRLTHRFLELRAPELQHAIRSRARILSALRGSLESDGLVEIETPALTRQSPEGAREFVVPSRQDPEKWYALAQSPQLHKQMLMVAGFERYYQVARCFRDEDGRADRQPEFTQLDLECAWTTPAEIRDVVERAVVAAASAVGISLPASFPVLTHAEAMDRFGVDRPDLRFDSTLIDATEVLAGTGFRRLREVLAKGGRAGLFTIPVQELSNAEMDRVRNEAIALGAPGLLWFRHGGETLTSDAFVERILTVEERTALASLVDSPEDGPVFLLAAPADRLAPVFSSLRARLAQRFGFIDKNRVEPCWVIDFPFFDRGSGGPSHHPFTAPEAPAEFGARFAGLLDKSARRSIPDELFEWPSLAWDLVMNGEEIGSGSIRIHDPTLQRFVFGLLGHSGAEIEDRFGFFLRALESGAPPHGGMALGLDRLVMTLLGRTSLREVVAFPKSADHSDPLTGAPAPISRPST